MLDRHDGSQASDKPKRQDPIIGVLDRSLTILSGILLTPFLDYLSGPLGYDSDRAYIPLNMASTAPRPWARPMTLASRWLRTPT